MERSTEMPVRSPIAQYIEEYANASTNNYRDLAIMAGYHDLEHSIPVHERAGKGATGSRAGARGGPKLRPLPSVRPRDGTVFRAQDF